MLLYTRRAVPKEPKRRSRAGCTHCKQKKKKCDEKRPCQRCVEHEVTCEYETPITRKRDRTSFSSSIASRDGGFESQSFPQDERLDDRPSDIHLLSGDDDVLEFFASESMSTAGAVVRSNRRPDLAMIAPSPIHSPLLEFSTPAFAEFSEKSNRRALVDHFCNVVSHLIVFEDSGNPFRQLVLPLSYSSSPVLNVIYALSSAHLEYRGVQTEESSLIFHNKALQSLAQLIDQKKPCNTEEILGAIMLLVYYEALVQRGSSNIVQGHLKGAMAIMNTDSATSTPTSLFLRRAFRFYDVITALSLDVAPNSAYEVSTVPLAALPTLPLNTNPVSNDVDVLLGLSTELWPLVHRLANLSSLKQLLAETMTTGHWQKASILRSELEETSSTIRTALTSWHPTIPPSVMTDEMSGGSTRVQSILYNAEAYRYSSLIYLYRSIQDLPRSNIKVQQMVHLSLEACANVVSNAEQSLNAPMAALLWPLFVAACEAIVEGDRILARQAFVGIERRQGMRNIMHAWEVVQELWSRVDQGAVDIDWRDISREKDFNLVFG